jgi:hypothetical protein
MSAKSRHFRAGGNDILVDCLGVLRLMLLYRCFDGFIF